MVDKIEDVMPQVEESIAAVIAEEESKAKQELLQEQNIDLGEVDETKPKMSNKYFAETIEDFVENIEEDLILFHKIEKEHAEKQRQQKFERQGREKFKPEHIYDTLIEERQNFKQEGSVLDIRGHDKTDVYPQNYPKSQAPSGSQTHNASDEHSVLAFSRTGPTNNFYVGSMVQIPSFDETRYGVINWIGFIPRISYRVAGIELVSY